MSLAEREFLLIKRGHVVQLLVYPKRRVLNRREEVQVVFELEGAEALQLGGLQERREHFEIVVQLLLVHQELALLDQLQLHALELLLLKYTVEAQQNVLRPNERDERRRARQQTD